MQFKKKKTIPWLALHYLISHFTKTTYIMIDFLLRNIQNLVHVRNYFTIRFKFLISTSTMFLSYLLVTFFMLTTSISFYNILFQRSSNEIIRIQSEKSIFCRLVWPTSITCSPPSFLHSPILRMCVHWVNYYMIKEKNKVCNNHVL